MPWISRGLRNGIVTSRYPHRADRYELTFRGTVTVGDNTIANDELQRVAIACPTGAISLTKTGVALDRGACILCGRCVAMLPTVFQFSSNVESSAFRRPQLVVPRVEEDGDALEIVRRELATRVKVLRRSIHVRHVDAGSDGSDEWEIAALTNPIYDVQRLGIFFTASPRHADVLLVTGVGSTGMIGPLLETLEVMPYPKVVVAAGVDAISGGLVGETYASKGGILASLPVDVLVPGSPATPFGLLHGILLALNLLETRTRSTATSRFGPKDERKGSGA